MSFERASRLAPASPFELTARQHSTAAMESTLQLRSREALKTAIGRQLAKKLNVGDDVMQMIYSFCLRPHAKLDVITSAVYKAVESQGLYDFMHNYYLTDSFEVSIDLRHPWPHPPRRDFTIDGTYLYEEEQPDGEWVLHWTGEGREDQDQFYWRVTEETYITIGNVKNDLGFDSEEEDDWSFASEEDVTYTWKELKARIARIRKTGSFVKFNELLNKVNPKRRPDPC